MLQQLMRCYQAHELGPWKQNEQLVLIISRQSPKNSKQTVSPPKTILPKLSKFTQILKQKQVKKRESKQKIQQQLKMNPIEIELENKLNKQIIVAQFSQARKSKTLSFNPPMISFYNKKHPKIKKMKQKKSELFNIQLQRSEDEFQQISKQAVSKIDLLKSETNQYEKNGAKNYQSLDRKQHAIQKRKSFSKLLQILRNSQLNGIWTQRERAETYLRKQRHLGVNHSFQYGGVATVNNQQAFCPYRYSELKFSISRKKSQQSNKKYIS